jgi:hypothetical protein
MLGTAKQDAVVAADEQDDWPSTSASSRRLFAPIIAGCVLFHRRYFSSWCAACMTSHPFHLSVFRFWH